MAPPSHLPQKSMFLLGAGASAEAGVPTTFEATEKLVAAIARDDRHWWAKTAQALNFVCGALVAYDSAAGQNPFGHLDVERVMSAVELLAERSSLEVTPFVGSWHPAVDVWDRPNPPSFFDQNLTRAILGQQALPKPGELIMELVESAVGSRSGDVYRRLAFEMVQELRSLLVIQHGSEQYLAPLLDKAAKPGGLTIATLNYDRGIEQLANVGSTNVQTGIESWVQDRTWGWAEDGIRLLKLHGSIDWCWDQIEHRDGELPGKTIVVTPEPENDRREPAVLFGQRGKLRAEGPFLSLLAEFERFLAQATELIVVGYSFRDDHINEAIRHWTAEDGQRAMTIIDPAFPESFRHRSRDFRASLMAYLNPPSHKPDAWAPRVRVIREAASTALANLPGADTGASLSTA